MTTTTPRVAAALGRGSPGERPWLWIAYGYGSVVAACLGYLVWSLPVQVTDSLGPLLGVNGLSLDDLLRSQIHEAGYFRPMRWVNIWWLFNLSAGQYSWWFRGWHVAQVVLLVLLFVHLLRPSTPERAVVVPLGLAVLLGLHTFAGMVNEAFPINHFMTVAVCALGAVALVIGPPRWWTTPAVALLFAGAALTLESGLLVGVAVIAMSVAGARGLSRWGTVVVAALLVGYFYVRFWLIDIGTPGLTERSSGFWLGTLSPDELVARFGEAPWVLYLYNVCTSVVSVLVSEPRAGRFDFVGRVLHDELRLIDPLELIVSILSTGLVIWYLWVRRQAWRDRSTTPDDWLVCAFPVVTAANGMLSYAYQKDVIMSPAGLFYALAVAIAVKQLILVAPAGVRGGWATAVMITLALSGTWALRTLELERTLRGAVGQMRNEWAYVDQWLEREDHELEPAEVRVTRALQAEAIEHHASRVRLSFAP